jgi:hypothetical protein
MITYAMNGNSLVDMNWVCVVSRGRGRIQLQVLDYLLRYEQDAQVEGDDDAFVPLADIAGDGASRSRVESVLRAAELLADEGLITLRRDYLRRPPSPAGSSVRANDGYVLMARLSTPSDEHGVAG